MKNIIGGIIIGMLVLIVFLVAVNLIFTFFVYIELKLSASKIQGYAVEKTLPEMIRINKEKIADNVIKLWNENDVKNLYELLGGVAQNQVSFENFKKQNTDMSSLGKIDKFTYIKYRYEGKFQGYDAFDLVYSIVIDDVGGDLTLSVIDMGNSFELLGFNISKNYIETD